MCGYYGTSIPIGNSSLTSPLLTTKPSLRYNLTYLPGRPLSYCRNSIVQGEKHSAGKHGR